MVRRGGGAGPGDMHYVVTLVVLGGGSRGFLGHGRCWNSGGSGVSIPEQARSWCEVLPGSAHHPRLPARDAPKEAKPGLRLPHPVLLPFQKD